MMPGPLFLDAGIVTLRPVEPEDTDIILEWMNHPDIRRYVHEFRLPYTEKDYQEWMYEGRDESDRVDLLICADNQPVGRVRLLPLDLYRRCGNLAYLIDPGHRGEGYATAAARELIQFGFRELGLNRIEAKALALNDGSRRVLEKLGFTIEGCRRESVPFDGEYVDEIYYGLLAEEWGAAKRSEESEYDRSELNLWDVSPASLQKESCPTDQDDEQTTGRKE